MTGYLAANGVMAINNLLAPSCQSYERAPAFMSAGPLPASWMFRIVADVT